MSNIKILLVEDDLSYAVELEMLVEELGYELMDTVDNSDSVFKILENEKPDLILMDIEIKGNLTGIELAERIQENKTEIGIIFITSFNDRETYNLSRKTKNFGYIVKPFNHLTLESTIETALMSIAKDENNLNNLEDQEEDDGFKMWEEDLIFEKFVFIKKRTRLEKVMIYDIQAIEADGNYCKIITEDKKFVLKMSLRKVYGILSNKNFVRTSKSNIINMLAITFIELSTNKIVINNKEFPIGIKYKEEVLQRIKMLN